MRVVQRAQERLLLIIAPEFADRVLPEELLVKLVPVLETRRAHSRRRTHGVGGLFGKGNVERPELAAQETGGREGLEFLAFAQVEALADVDEGRHRLIERAERSGDDRTEVRRGGGLRRGVTGVPLVLVPRVKDESQITGGVASNQSAAVDDARDLLQ